MRARWALIEAQVGLGQAQARAEGPLEGPNRAPESIEKRVPPPENAPHKKGVENLGFERFLIIKLTVRLPNGLKIP